VTRLLAVLAVLAGAALVVVGNPSPSGESARPPEFAQGRTTHRRDAVVVGDADGQVRRVEPASGASRPRTLIIGSLGIRASVVPLETSGRTLYPPRDTSKVGWWRDGATPGAARGSTVVTGHTVVNGDGVFDKLARLRLGDRVRLVTEKGPLRYVVRNEASYRKATLAHRAQDLFSQSSDGRLVLVTCEGWNGEDYLANHVVIATPARPDPAAERPG
jgi:LPXTG-site transpeptidase (sortase) family protein